MSLESQVQSIAESLVAQSAAALNPNSLQRQYDSQDVTRGIDASGIRDALETGLRDVSESMIGVGALLDADLRELSLGVGLSNQRLQGIEEALRTPLQTAAQERFSRGLRAFNRGWLPEAVEEFDAAVRDDPYLAVAHLMRALASMQIDDTPEAALASLLKAERYGTPDEPAVASGAALLATRALQHLDRHTEAKELTARVVEQFPTCPELLLLKAELDGDGSALPAAIELAPELAFVAALKVPNAFAAMASDPSGDHLSLVESATRIAELTRSILAELPAAELDVADRGIVESMTAQGTPGMSLLTACRVHGRSRIIHGRLMEQSDVLRLRSAKARIAVETALKRRAWRRAEIERLTTPVAVGLDFRLSSRLNQAERNLANRQAWIDKNGSWASPSTMESEYRDLDLKKNELAAVRAEVHQTQELARIRQLESNQAKIDELLEEDAREVTLSALDEDPSAEARHNLLTRLDEEARRFPKPGRIVPFVRS